MNNFFKLKKQNLPFPLRCGVISDTHAYNLQEKDLEIIKQYFSGMQYILHLGDVTHPAVINDLEILGFTVLAVKGNNDYMLNLPNVIMITSGSYNIAMVHGNGGSYGNIKQRALRVVDSLSDIDADILLFGHTHVPCNENINNIIFLNPGSLTSPRLDPHGIYSNDPHLAILNLDEHGIKFEIFSIKD